MQIIDDRIAEFAAQFRRDADHMALADGRRLAVQANQQFGVVGADVGREGGKRLRRHPVSRHANMEAQGLQPVLIARRLVRFQQQAKDVARLDFGLEPLAAVENLLRRLVIPPFELEIVVHHVGRMRQVVDGEP